MTFAQSSLSNGLTGIKDDNFLVFCICIFKSSFKILKNLTF